MTKIKICGLSRTEDIIAVNEAMPDYIGFVFAESKRRVSIAQAKELKALLDPKIKAVGVFVNAPIEMIVSCCNEGIIDLIQLHGDESKEYIEILKAETGKPIIKAVRVKNRADIIDAEDCPCDCLLFDTYVKDQFGGSGEQFDRSLIPKRSKTFFLAGGLDSRNIIEAVKRCDPFCVDISSGVETDGFKDKVKIKEIVTIVRSISK